ncbi:MAG: DUF494 family protein [bacterium]|nr:DUF494 family protein [bacterium]
MREKMFAMIRILVEKALEDRSLLSDEREMTALLESRGYSQEEIYDAVSWLQQIHGDWSGGEEALRTERRKRSIRVFHPEERLAFSPAAQGLVHRLYALGALDDHLREEVLQRCIDLTDEEIDAETVKTVILLVLFKENRDVLGEDIQSLLRIDTTRLVN